MNKLALKVVLLSVLLSNIFILPQSLLASGIDNLMLGSRNELPEFYDGRVMISKSYDFNKKNVAANFEWGANLYQVYYQHNISEELMANGFTVIERVQFDKVLRELALDQTGAVKDKDQKNKEDSRKDYDEKGLTTREYSKSELKKLGELLGVSYLVQFALIPKEREKGLFVNRNTDWFYLRFVDLETSEVVITASLVVDRSEVNDIIIIRSLIKAITSARLLKSPIKEVFINYFSRSENYDNFLKAVGATQVLYKEAFPKNYAVVYVK